MRTSLHSFQDILDKRCSVSGKRDGSHLLYANMEIEVQMKSVGTITHIEPMVYSVADVSRRNCHIMPPTYVIHSSLQFGKNMAAAISTVYLCLNSYKF